MAVKCRVCQNNEFYAKDGQYFCVECHTQSQEHGQDTYLDEEALGVFDGNRLEKLNLSAKKVKKKNRKHRVAFTNTDSLSFVLKGWVDELISLGADPKLNEIAFSVWARFLRSVDRAFTDKGVKPIAYHAAKPTRRDVQVHLFGRKRIISSRQYVKRQSNLKKRKKKSARDSESNSDLDLDAKEAKKLERKTRRALYATLSSITDEHTDSSASISSFCSDMTMMSEEDRSDASNSSTEKDYSESSEDDEVHKAVLNRMKTMKTGNFVIRTEEMVNFFNTFVCLVLSVLINKDNQFTLSDLMYWCETGSLSYKTAVRHIPSVMALNGFDKSFYRQQRRQIDRARITTRLCLLAGKLKLRDINFNHGDTLWKVMDGFLREFCLPKKLKKIIFAALSDTHLLEVKQTFPDKAETLTHDLIISAVDTRCLSLILFALKYIFILDDITEEFISNSAVKFNEENAKRPPDGCNHRRNKFVFRQWLDLSRHRVFLAVKHHVILRRLFKPLCPRTALDDKEEVIGLAREIEDSKVRQDCGKTINPAKREGVIAAVEKILSDLPEVHCAGPELANSHCPLSDFTRYCLENPEDFDLSEREVRNLDELTKLRNTSLRFPKEQVLAAGEESVLEIKRNASYLANKKSGAIYWPEFTEEQNSSFLQGNITNPAKCFWRAKWKDMQFFRSNRSTVEEREAAIRSGLPDNFLWILEYFSLRTRIPILEIMYDLIFVEEVINAKDVAFFGQIIHHTNSFTLKAAPKLQRLKRKKRKLNENVPLK